MYDFGDFEFNAVAIAVVMIQFPREGSVFWHHDGFFGC